MIVWADGGWDYRRCIGFTSVLREGVDEVPLVVPVLRPVSSSLMCEYEALVLALSLTSDDPSTRILMDSRTVVDQVAGDAGCSVLELASYLSWARRRIGSRRLEWAPREANRAHVPMSRAFEATESWMAYELEALRKRRPVDRQRAEDGAVGDPDGS